MVKGNHQNLGKLVLAALVATTSLAMVFAQPAKAEVSEAIGLKKSVLVVGQTYYISTDGLNVRSSDSTTEKNVVGKLGLNDQVQVVDVLGAETPLVQVNIIKSKTVSSDVAPELFVSKDYLSTKVIETKQSKYFVVQNIATEKTRVYERCFESANCAHKMIFETDMVVGRPESGTDQDPLAFVTRVGHARISEWVKFYTDTRAHYPAWYTAGQRLDTIPAPLIRGMSDLTASRRWSVTGRDGESTIYGAFGWYAAKVEPYSPNGGMNFQWMHGTIGWGKDQSRAIDLTRGFLINLFGDPGSSGCTRLENQAISYLRHLLPVGTDIYRVYALEGSREVVQESRPFSRYQKEFAQKGMWSWILLTDGANKTGGLTADAATIYSKNIPFTPGGNMIERGFFYVDHYPNPQPLTNATASSGQSGDRYDIGARNFRGVYLVDEGRFVGYAHPSTYATGGRVVVGGFDDFKTSVPDFLQTNGKYYPAR